MAHQLKGGLADQMGDIGFAADDNEVVVITPKDAIKLEKANKRHLSRRLIQLIAEQVSQAGNSDSG